MHPRQLGASLRSRDFGPGRIHGLIGGGPGVYRKECPAVEKCGIPPRCGTRDYTAFRAFGILPQ